MIYVILIALFLGSAIWAFYQGRELESLRKELSQLKGYAERQRVVLDAFSRAIHNKEKLSEFMDKVSSCDDADNFNKLLKAYMSGADTSTDT